MVNHDQGSGVQSPVLHWAIFAAARRGDRLTGFTILEVIVVFTIMGILAAIVAPGWMALQNSLELKAAQDKVFQELRQTQTLAEHRRIRQQFSLREVNGVVQVAIHDIDALPNEIYWESLDPSIHIDPDRTSLRSRNSVYRMQFNQYGNANGQIGRVTLLHEDGGRMRRCVIVSTLLGHLRTAKEQSTRDRACSPR